MCKQRPKQRGIDREACKEEVEVEEVVAEEEEEKEEEEGEGDTAEIAVSKKRN